MDPLSLLAELYGEGRITTEKFRVHRLTGLEKICARKPKDLARMLDLPERSAKRILVEAREMMQEKLFIAEKSLRGMESTADGPQSTPQDMGSDVGGGAGAAAPAVSPVPRGFKSDVLDMLVKRFP